MIVHSTTVIECNLSTILNTYIAENTSFSISVFNINYDCSLIFILHTYRCLLYNQDIVHQYHPANTPNHLSTVEHVSLQYWYISSHYCCREIQDNDTPILLQKNVGIIITEFVF